MNSRQEMARGITRCVAISILSFGLAGALGATGDAADADLEPAPPPDTTVVREVQGGGAQVYACRQVVDGTFVWTLLGPKAVLINDDGSDFGTHAAGPTWTAKDGSSIAADGIHPLAKIARPQGVPSLLLRVTTSHGDGVLRDVRFVRRTATAGGLPPAIGCDAAHVDSTVAIHYSAIYTFYR